MKSKNEGWIRAAIGVADAAEVVGRLRRSGATLQKFIVAFGDAAQGDAETALRDMGLAIAAYETEDPDFHPFSSKFDYWLQGRAPLTAQEKDAAAAASLLSP
jgi:cytochrome c peroxidase